MPKNKGLGGRNFRKGNHSVNSAVSHLTYADGEEQKYARVTKILGDCRVMAILIDGTEVLCHIRGKLKKKVWINADDIVLIALRPDEPGKADVLTRYLADQLRDLKSSGIKLPTPENMVTTEEDGLIFETETEEVNLDDL